MLAGGDFDIVFTEGGADSGVTQDIVRRGGLFDKERFKGGEMGEVSLCFGDRPNL